MYRNLELYNLDPKGHHIQLSVTANVVSNITTIIDAYYASIGADQVASQQSSWVLDYQLLGGDAYVTVDGKTDPRNDVDPAGAFGRPQSQGLPFQLWRTEFRQGRIIPAGASDITLIGQIYYYNTLN